MTQHELHTASGGCPVTRLLKPDPATAPASAAGRLGVFLYGLIAYALFFVTFLYAVGFVGNWFVPKSIDTGTAVGLAESLLINTALLSLFVVQHTIMARPAFKRWWTRFVPVSIERSTFVLAATACLALVFWQWRPLPEVLWSVTHPVAAAALSAVSISGWLLALASSFMVSHWDLFGLRQVYLRATGRPYTHIGFKERGVYRLVRHPLMLGFFIFVWATPHMTVGHLFFSAMITAYIFLGTALEERDLVAHLGAQYEDYRRRVPGIFPIPRALRSRS